MTTDVINQLAGTLDAELQKARENLRGVDSNIKKLFGKDAFELNNFGGSGRGRRSFGNSQDPVDERDADYEQNNYSRGGGYRKRDDRSRDRFDDEPGEKRRRVDTSARPPPVVIGPRIRPRYDDDNYSDRDRDRERERSRERGSGRRLQSRIVSSSKEKSREEVLAEQSKDRKGRDRNRRMFGALLGTLQRFKQEETKLKNKEEKRAQIETKIDEAAKKEREEVKKEKQQLVRDRKLQITEIKRLELKRTRIAELESWEAKTSYLTNFIRTEAKPHIFYLPKILNPIMECRLDQSKQYVTEMIASKRKLVLEDLEDFEQRSRRYWEGRVDGESKKDEVDPMDEDISNYMELELKEIMKMEDGEDFTITVFENKKEVSETLEIKDGEEKQQQQQQLKGEEEEKQEEEDEEINLPVDKEQEEEEENVPDEEKNSNHVKGVKNNNNKINNSNDEHMDEENQEEQEEEEEEEEEKSPSSHVLPVEFEEEDDDDSSRINEESKENFDTSN